MQLPVLEQGVLQHDITKAHMVCIIHAASRDQSVKLWCNDEQVGATIYKPLETRLQHKVLMVMMLFASLHNGVGSSACGYARVRDEHVHTGQCQLVSMMFMGAEGKAAFSAVLVVHCCADQSEGCEVL